MSMLEFGKMFLKKSSKTVAPPTDERYGFGTSLRESILLGKDTKTDLRVHFEERLFQNTGWLALHCSFDASRVSPVLFLHVRSSDHEKLLATLNQQAIDGIYYPNEKEKTHIWNALQASFLDFDLPAIDLPPADKILISDYRQSATSVYFSLFMVEIDEAVRKAFPNAACHLRFCRSHQSRHYYLIFADQTAMETADRNGTVRKIIRFVFEYCRSNDPLHIFEDEPIRPYVTTVCELRNSGQAMGIMRENPDFTTL